MKENYYREYKDIGNKIKLIRLSKNMTQEKLSELAGISVSYLSKIEAPNCNKSFSLDLLFVLAEVFEIDVKDFFK